MFPFSALSYVNSSLGYFVGYGESSPDFEKSPSTLLHDDVDVHGDYALHSESEFDMERSSWYGFEWLRRRRSPLKANNLLMIEGEPLSREILDRYLNDQTKIYDEKVYERRQRMSEDKDCCDSLHSCNTTVDLSLNEIANSAHSACENCSKECCFGMNSSCLWNHSDLDELQASNDKYDEDCAQYYDAKSRGSKPLVSVNSWGGKYKFQVEVFRNEGHEQTSVNTSISSFRLYKWRLDLKMISS
mmetsp:Transcript_13049/g.30012  ORF Transcript_13049/g.30012 Transcript_13049/m.30012 type:complete len:244 (-) Transcript_13049:150-881(-)